jgi:hypothetical protein
MTQPARVSRVAKWWRNEGDTEDSHALRAAVDGGLADADFNQLEGAMNEQEMTAYQQRYKARWMRWLDALSWSQGPMATWAPALNEQQKQEQSEYVKLHKCPF